MSDLRLLTAYMTAAFCSAVTALYVIADAQPSPLVYLFVLYAPALAVVAWLDHDARRTNTAGAMDFALYMWVAWPVLLPWYIFRTRGIRGWRLLVALLALIGAPIAAAFVTSLLMYVFAAPR